MGEHRYDKVTPMPTFILFLTLVFTLVTSQTAWADGVTLEFNPSDLMDPNLEDTMVDLAANPDRGERALTRIIEDIELKEGQFSPRLYAYLSELGQIKQANRQHREAIDLFQRMQTLTHWSDGVYSPLQLESIRMQSLSYASLGRLKDVDRLENFHLRVAEHSANDDTELVAPIWRLGDWQRASLQYRKALANYERALRIVETNNMDLPYKVRTLKAKALTEHLARLCCADETLLTIALLSETNQYVDQLAVRQARLNAADMSLIRGRDNAIDNYESLIQAPAAILGLSNHEQVFEVLARAENPIGYSSSKEIIYMHQQDTVKIGKAEEPVSTFSTGNPVRLCAKDTDLFRQNPESFVDVSIDVSAEGRPANIKLTGTAPSKLKRYLKSTLTKSAYRPAIKDGKPEATTLTFRQHFSEVKPLQSASVSDWRGILTEHACQLVAAR
jgi:tetratricopeptide (TPR) repeat protein